jgi:predicted RNase H-like nuclease
VKASAADERIAGVDGCHSGWLCISQGIEGDDLRSAVHPGARSLLGQSPAPLMMAIDVPIGLVEDGERDCDRIARSMLARRACCVFSAPTREMITAPTHDGASAPRLRRDGK